VPLAAAGKVVVQRQSQQELAARAAAGAVVGNRKALRLDQAGRVAQQGFAFAHRFARQASRNPVVQAVERRTRDKEFSWLRLGYALVVTRMAIAVAFGISAAAFP
jgi:hypothetical protein